MAKPVPKRMGSFSVLRASNSLVASELFFLEATPCLQLSAFDDVHTDRGTFQILTKTSAFVDPQEAVLWSMKNMKPASAMSASMCTS